MNRTANLGSSRLDVLADQLTQVVGIVELHQRRHDAAEGRLANVERRPDPTPQPVARDDGARLDAIERHMGSIATLLAQLLVQRSARPETTDEVFARLEAEADARR